MPRLAAFPKAFIRDLCTPQGMTLQAWVDLPAPLPLDGFELYSGLREMADPRRRARRRRTLYSAGLPALMACVASPLDAARVSRPSRDTALDHAGTA